MQEKLGIQCPFIVENGAGIFIPPDSIFAQAMPQENRYIKISQSRSYLELRLFFKQLQKEYPLRGFGDMQVREVMDLTGLGETGAKYSMQRDFTEPFILEGETDLNALQNRVAEAGLEIVKGGRFFHLISSGQDKAKAMKHLTHMYEEHFNKKLQMIALGDSANDFTMLKSADIGVLIPLYDGSFADIDTDDIIKAEFPGPKGWNKALLEILDVR